MIVFRVLLPPAQANAVLKGSWDLVIGVISKVSTVIISYNPH